MYGGGKNSGVAAPLKRSFDPMVAGAEVSEKKKKKSGPSESKKEMNAIRAAQKQEQYSVAASEIAPLVAAVVDSFGGCTTLGLVQQDPKVLAALEAIPEGYSKKLKKIIEMYPDYIVSLADSHVATALGYDNGTVSASGEVNKELMQANFKKKKESDKAKGIPPLKPQPKKKNSSEPEMNVALQPFRSDESGRQLEDACQMLYDAAMQSDEKAFMDAIEATKKARGDAFYLGVKGFVDYVRLYMIGRGLQQGELMKVQELTLNSEIVNLHNAIPSPPRKKMYKLLADFPEWFNIETDPATGLVSVSLTREGTRKSLPLMQRPRMGGNLKGGKNTKGGGKGW